MHVKRIVANIHTEKPEAARKFYSDILGLDILMDLGWIVTMGSAEDMQTQISFMSEGGSGTQTPDISVEVDDLDEALQRCKDAGVEIEYGPANEPWGVKRFYVRDPFGRLVNILAHA